MLSDFIEQTGHLALLGKDVAPDFGELGVRQAHADGGAKARREFPRTQAAGIEAEFVRAAEDGVANHRSRRSTGRRQPPAGAHEIDADENAAEVEDHSRAQRLLRVCCRTDFH